MATCEKDIDRLQEELRAFRLALMIINNVLEGELNMDTKNMNVTNERLEAFYKELDTLLNHAPCEDDCTDEENQMYSDMANLKESMFDAGYGR